MIVKSLTENLKSYIENGRISIIDELLVDESDIGSITTEIVGQIRNGEEIYIYSPSIMDTESNNSDSIGSRKPSIQEEEIVEEILQDLKKHNKRILIVKSSDHPMPLPSWTEVSEKPINGKKEDLEDWKKNVSIQKAWVSKFPFLSEHYDCIPINQRINAWRNRLEESENVNNHKSKHKDVLETDPDIGNDINGLFKEKKDIFEDDTNIGEDIAKLFEEKSDD